ncbi:hypothetical protein ACQCX2_18275 [Propionibacteriaceae bacterium Y1700]|uniref:hypothetical protein n=1 Tax=Microlunatus sp. Y1700 TaxID=3418487 RepID=UPI003DA6D907
MKTTVSQKIVGLVLGTTSVSARPCEGPTYTQYACWVSGRIPTRFTRSCYRDQCAGRTYCGKWTAYQCVSHC